jgi:hypothetical protein
MSAIDDRPDAVNAVSGRPVFCYALRFNDPNFLNSSLELFHEAFFGSSAGFDGDRFTIVGAETG